ncbi:MAG: hypothetical protein D6719_02270 [Candidatus Dadabacteria bacterium]|nr:MAG: hypothetical protein D6719_02270 [Candidatus Dadabacteria bacterium]
MFENLKKIITGQTEEKQAESEVPLGIGATAALPAQMEEALKSPEVGKALREQILRNEKSSSEQ